MTGLRHFPSGAIETMPPGNLAVVGYVEHKGKPYCVYLAVPNSNPRKGFAFDLEEGAITDVILDLYLDREAEVAKKPPRSMIGSFDELSKRLMDANRLATKEGMDFGKALDIGTAQKTRERIEQL